MAKYTNKTKKYVLILACMLIGITAVIVLWRTSGTSDIYRENDEIEIAENMETNVVFLDLGANEFDSEFYIAYQIERSDGYTIARILAQTEEGYFIAKVLPQSWPVYEPPRLSSHLAIVCPQMEIIESIFHKSPPPWEFFHFAVADRAGFLYVLGNGANGSLYLYVYDKYANEIARHEWRSGIALGSSWEHMHIFGDVIVITHGSFISMVTIHGDVLFGTMNIFYPNSAQEFSLYGEYIAGFITGTLGNGYFYALIQLPDFGFSLRKIEIPSGETVWDERLPSIMNTHFSLAFNEDSHILYLKRAQGLYVFDEETLSVRQVRCLLDTELYRFIFLHEFLVFPTSFFVTHEGVLHISYVKYGNVTYLYEWTIVRLEGEIADARLEEVRQEIEAMGSIRIADVSQHSLHDFLREIARNNNLMLNVDILGTGNTPSYVEQLVAALYASTADWDVVHLPLGFIDLPRLIELDLLVNIYDVLGEEMLNDEETYFVNILEHSQINGQLNFVPHMFSNPILLIPNDYYGLDQLREKSLTWTWEEFLTIVREMYIETGIPPISAPDADALTGWAVPISNIPPFYLYNEDILRNMPSSRGDFSRALYLYRELTHPRYSLENGKIGHFTFLQWGIWGVVGIMMEHGVDLSQTHTLLQIPAMRGEHPFHVSAGYGFLNSGSSTEQAVNSMMEYFYNASMGVRGTPVTGSVVRLSEDAVIRAMWPVQYAPLSLFEEYNAIRNRLNARLALPLSVTDPLMETVESFVHGVVSSENAISRVEDILWLFLNE